MAKILKIIISSFIIWRSILIIIASTSALFINPKPDFLGKQFGWSNLPVLWHWANFDGEHYLWIAKFGYRQFEYAFFPLFPVVIKYVSNIFGDVLLSGLVISNLSLLALLFILYKLFLLDFKEKIVFKGLILFLAFPAAFFLSSVYTESFFLCLVAGSIFAARKKQFYLAAILAMAASATRLVGIFLLPSLLVIWFREGKDKKDLFPLFLIPFGLIGVMIFDWFKTGDLLNFVHVQPQFGANRSGSELILLPQVVYRYLKIFFNVNPFSHIFFISFQEFLLTISAIFIWLKVVRRLKIEYLIFSLAVIITPTLTGTFSSMPRYILAAFPLFFGLADATYNKYIFWLLVMVMFVLQLLNVVLFVNGYWVS